MLRTNRPILAYFDAIKNLRIRQLALLLKAGYDPNLMINSRGQNGLQYMVQYFGATDAHFRLQSAINKSTYMSIAKLLLDSGLDPNASDILSGETAIFDAIRFDDREMVAFLLNYVDLSLRNKNGETALMCAARFGSKQVMRMMLEHLRALEMDGYFLRQRNRFGMTPLELARAENIETAKVLTKHLIAFGHHTGSMLARSASHHQLAPAAGPVRAAHHHQTASIYAPGASSSDQWRTSGVGPYHNQRRRVLPATATALDLYGADELSSADDDEIDLLMRAPADATNVVGAFDPKAAEFNQYLLEQQQYQRDPDYTGRYGRNNISDEDADFYSPSNAGGRGGQTSSSGLTRSRSCMLGPPTGSRSERRNGASKKSSENAAGNPGESNVASGRGTMG